ncbi:MAG TPA: sigma-70 family RNA polymerase sigma factor [Planctomycetota bacterium]
MFALSADAALVRYRANGDPRDLARLFDRAAPELLRFARHLASREAAAEDLVQETFLALIERPAAHDGERAALPWLCGVLANRARAARRRARRELDPERLAREPAAEPAAAAEAAELRAELARGIEALAEPYRPVLRLYLAHGLEPGEIAAALERPPGTVRAQLARGLEALRRALPAGLVAGVAGADAAGRGLARLRADVLAQAGATGLLESAPLLGGLALVTSKMLLAVAALAGALVLGLLWLRREPSSDAPAALAAAAPVELAPPSGAAEPVTAPAREPAPVGASTARAETPPAAQPAAAEARVLVVRVVRVADASPLAGAGVCLQDLARARDLAGRSAVVRTDAEGRARFPEPPPGTVMVYVDRAGSVRACDTPVEGELEIEVEVPLGLDVHGLVVGADERPVPGATVLAHGALIEPLVLATTDDEGRFELADVQPGLVLEAEADGHGPSLAQPLLGESGKDLDLCLTLTGRARRVSGLVLGPDGEPAGGALVIAFEPERPPLGDAPHPRPRFARADAGGNYALRVPEERALRLAAVSVEPADGAPAVSELAQGAHDAVVDLQLVPAAELEGSVSFATGAAVPTQITAFSERESALGYMANVVGLHVTTLEEAGEYRLRGLLPGTYRLHAYAGGESLAAERTVAAGERARWDVELGAGGRLRVLCRLPAEARKLDLIWLARLERLADDGSGEFVSFLPLSATGLLDFPGVAPGTYRVLLGASHGGLERAHLTVLASDPLTPREEPWELAPTPEQVTLCRVNGRLVDASGVPRPHALVNASGGAPGLASLCTATSGADGSFELTRLVAGDWSLALGEHPGPPLATVQGLRPGETRALGELVVP